MTTTQIAIRRPGVGLRATLGLDAILTGINGLAYLAASSVLDEALGMPTSVIRGVGALVLLYAVAVLAVRAPATISRRLAYGVVVTNVVWAVASFAVAIGGWYSPARIGTVWIVTQACAVAGIAALQVTALRRNED